MRLRSLIHLLEAVKALVRPDAVTVLGSSSLLAVDGSLGDEGQPLEISMDADLLMVPCDARMANVLHEAVGENSLFHREYGVYADILRPDIDEALPPGWQQRTIPLAEVPGVWCLEKIDLALVKLGLGREKDMALVQALISKGLVSLDAIRERYQILPLDEARLVAIGKRLNELKKTALR
ncbi:MAG TPA: hypothetical protein PKE26_03995 [Kiritimatiellia bacterium]|nr:hypothetical protein [Kiritimatiellia bacterium]HMO98251.1 hypothetical protein [Kiritimatiellia bacterium]HMP96596.1 hypothetical protein [Kiritimatiellia bacterium]